MCQGLNIVQQIEETSHFKAFHMGIVVGVPFITKNRIIFLKYSWSAIEETVRYLRIYEQVHHVAIIHNPLRAIRPSEVIEKYTALKILLEPSLTILFLDHCIRE